MKNFGFTLPELLLTLVIIGVVSAIVAPNIANLTPDKNKYKVLKAYNTLTTINETLLNDKAIYWTPATSSKCPNGYWDSTQEECSCEGLECTQQPVIAPYNTSDYSGQKKYVALLIDSLEGETIDNLTSGVKFETVDGMVWSIEHPSSSTPNVELDVDGSKNKIYKFNIDKYGHVTGADDTTKSYIKSKF